MTAKLLIMLWKNIWYLCHIFMSYKNVIIMSYHPYNIFVEYSGGPEFFVIFPQSVMKVGASSFPAVIPVQYWKWCRVYFFRSFFLGSISTFLASNYKISSVRAHFLTELTWNIESNYRFWKSSVYLCRKKICRYYIYISHYKIFIYILEKNLQFNFILL